MNALIFTLAFMSASIQFPGGEQDGWQTYQQIKGIDILYKFEECHDVKNGTHYGFYILKIVNTTGKVKRISWVQQLTYDGVTYPADKNIFTGDVGANRVLEGSCETENPLRIFVRFLNYTDQPELTGFELKNILIEDI
jgi:hypothetical protein